MIDQFSMVRRPWSATVLLETIATTLLSSLARESRHSSRSENGHLIRPWSRWNPWRA